MRCRLKYWSWSSVTIQRCTRSRAASWSLSLAVWYGEAPELVLSSVANSRASGRDPRDVLPPSDLKGRVSP